MMKKVLVMLLMSTLGLTQTMADNNTMVKKFLNVAKASVETRASAFSGGTGTEADPYLISTPEDLNQLAADIEKSIMYEGKYFKMTNDIDMSATANFRPIGNNIETSQINAFCGVFDGDYYTVRGINSVYEGVNSIGIAMFGIAQGATIKNLYMEDCTFQADAMVAPIVAVAIGATVQNCHVGKNVTANAAKMFNAAGVVCGTLGMPSTIENCSSGATVHTDSYNAGGIISATSDGSAGTVVKNCIYYGKADGRDVVGGIIGTAEQPVIISDCANFGEISANINATGIQCLYPAREMKYVDLSNCYNTGLVKSESDQYDAISYGNIFQDGGEGSCVVANCFYANDVEGARSNTGVGMLTEEMKTQDLVDKLNNGREDGPWRIQEGISNGFPIPFEYVTTGIENVAVASTASISYNAGVVTVAGAKAGDKFAVVDMAGRTVKMAEAQNGEFTIDLSNVPAGVYVIGNGSISKKIVK